MTKLVYIVCLIVLISACSRKEETTSEEKVQFELLPSELTGINFSNTLVSTDEFNVYRYRNFYNGGGVAIGDINNDGLEDIYLTSNLNQNKLYLNKGNFQFEDITVTAQVGGTKAWSTGVAMVDVNADGFLDIYVCNSGDVKGDNKQNEFFINNGDLTFTERAEELGLDDKGYSTHASFFDYDKDGDLDLYLLNNSYQAIGSFNLTKNERPKRDILGGDKLFENKDGTFFDVSEKAGIYGSVIGFGLGVTVGDMNNDNWQDIYVSNDFFERDYLYINQKDGTFNECLTTSLNSISGASMGADAADINNDGFTDIFVTEMLPSEYDRLKTVTTFEDWNKYQYNLKNDYFHQFTRNMLQLNNTNLTFSEIGRFSGVEASDWSWGALFFDMDNDGLKDLYIANGIYKDLTNQDYLKYISNQEVIESMVNNNNEVNYKKLIDIIPSNKVKNHAYINKGDLKFEREENGLNTPSFSNGAAYADLDNDGDFDLIVNNVNMPLFVYKNNLKSDNNYLKVVLKGEGMNKNAIGAKLELTSKTNSYFLEQQPVRGFQSSMDNRPNFGFQEKDGLNLTVTWPSGKITQVSNIAVNTTITLEEKDGILTDEIVKKDTSPKLFLKENGVIDFVHKENNYVDFNIERLLPFMRSTEGPKTSVGDVNGDGQNDLFIGGSKGNVSKLYIQKDNHFDLSKTTAFDTNKNSEATENVFFDADGDGDLDLYVCNGGIEFSKFSPNYLDKLYFNDGLGNFSVSNQILPTGIGYHSSSTVCVADVDNDNDLDLFVGERAIPNAYGKAGSGFLLINDGSGKFTEKSDSLAPNFKDLGMITDALFIDLNNNGFKDLVVVGEFMGIQVFENVKGKFSESKNTQLSNLKGWWNTIEQSDLDNDGDMDLIVGNHGLNSRFRATENEPITLYANDFDGNSYIDPILTFTEKDGKQYPYALRHNLVDQLKYLSKQYPDYESFKNAAIDDIFTQEQLDSSIVLEVNTLSSVMLINKGDFNFEVKDLPFETQFSPVYAINTYDFDNDGDQDILLGGNLNGVMPEYGRYDASFSNYLENLGSGNFKYHQTGKGLNIKGQIRDIKVIDEKVFIAKNNDSLEVYKY